MYYFRNIKGQQQQHHRKHSELNVHKKQTHEPFLNESPTDTSVAVARNDTFSELPEREEEMSNAMEFVF